MEKENKKYTEIVKEKLKEIKNYKRLNKKHLKKDTISDDKGNERYWESFKIIKELKANLLGMQIAIKSELEFLECFDDFEYCKKCKLCKFAREALTEEIKECKNALKLIKNGKRK